MRKWMSEWVSEWVNESMNEWMNEWMWMNVNECEWMNESMNEWMNEWMWMNVNECEWMNEWVSEWVSEWEHESTSNSKMKVSNFRLLRTGSTRKRQTKSWSEESERFGGCIWSIQSHIVPLAKSKKWNSLWKSQKRRQSNIMLINVV
jgi:hypothetical protein